MTCVPESEPIEDDSAFSWPSDALLKVQEIFFPVVSSSFRRLYSDSVNEETPYH